MHENLPSSGPINFALSFCVSETANNLGGRLVLPPLPLLRLSTYTHREALAPPRTRSAERTRVPRNFLLSPRNSLASRPALVRSLETPACRQPVRTLLAPRTPAFLLPSDTPGTGDSPVSPSPQKRKTILTIATNTTKSGVLGPSVPFVHEGAWPRDPGVGARTTRRSQKRSLSPRSGLDRVKSSRGGADRAVI